MSKAASKWLLPRQKRLFQARAVLKNSKKLLQCPRPLGILWFAAAVLPAVPEPGCSAFVPSPSCCGFGGGTSGGLDSILE